LLWNDINLIFTIDDNIVTFLNNPGGIGKPLSVISIKKCSYKITDSKLFLREKKTKYFFETYIEYNIKIKDPYYIHEIDALLKTKF
jgi:hypothetical protein